MRNSKLLGSYLWRSGTVLLVVGTFLGATASTSVAAAPTTVTWNVSSLVAGQVEKLSTLVSTNSPGEKTWSQKGSCVLTPTSKPTKLTMGSTGSCTLTVKIAKSKRYPARTSTRTIALATSTTATTTTPAIDSPSTTSSDTTTSTVAVVVYNVGDTGPSGGKIFYKDLSRPAGSQYFEAACAGWSDGTCGGSDLSDPETSWGCMKKLIATKEAIGAGKKNTTKILSGCETVGIAAQLAADLELGGQTDWFLPSKDELNQMFIQRKLIDGFSSNRYWSSSEAWRTYLAWYHSPRPGFQHQRPEYKASDSQAVRPVRAF